MIDRLAAGASFRTLGLLALVASVTASVSALRTCDDDRYAPNAPSIAADNQRFTLAWDGPAAGGTRAIYAQQFDARGKATGDRVTVFRDAGVRGHAAIVRTLTGYVAIGTHHDRDAEKDFTNHLFSVPLDHKGRVIGEPRMYFFGDELCDTPVLNNDKVFAAVRLRATNHRHPNDMLLLYLVDDRRPGDRFITIASTSFGACATATNGPDVAVGFRRYDPDTRENQLIVQFDARRAGPTLRVALPGTASVGLSLVSIGDEWAAMYGEGDDAVTILRFGPDGVHTTTTLPGVDPGSASLAATTGGLVVSSRDGGTIKLTAVDGGRTIRTRSAGRSPSNTAVAGLGGGCAAAWTTRGGRTAQLEVLDSCP